MESRQKMADGHSIHLYPGQGSQHVGMGLDLYRRSPVARRRFAQADRLLGFALSRLCFEGPSDALDGDLNAQLATYTVSCILTDLLQAHGGHPAAVGGYSSGYYAAAYAAGAFSFTRGLALVRQAGEMLLEEGDQFDGGMAVIFGLPTDAVAALCRQAGDVDVAICNTPRQTIVSGLRPAVGAVIDASLAQGALDAYRLPAATAYHSRFMAAAAERFRRSIVLAGIRGPALPLISYSTLTAAASRRALVDTMALQLAGPVRWCELVKHLQAGGPGQMVEVGAGTLITRTVRWIDRRIDIVTAEALTGPAAAGRHR